jgi:hypothetical protein
MNLWGTSNAGGRRTRAELFSLRACGLPQRQMRWFKHMASLKLIQLFMFFKK